MEIPVAELKKTFYPGKEFEDNLDGLAAVLVEEGWEVPGVSAALIAEDAAAQRAERTAHDALRREYLALHEEFGLAQLVRYKRFMAVLEALRGAFREDKVVQTKLKEFGRKVGRNRKAAEEPSGKEGAA
jgi:hypothetical protein